MKAFAAYPPPHPALRATFSQGEKGVRMASLRGGRGLTPCACRAQGLDVLAVGGHKALA